MKAQLALIEAFLASTVLAGMTATTAVLMAAPASINLTRDLAVGNAAYDFVSVAYANSTISDCLENLTYPCSGPILQQFRSVYGLKGMSISVDSRTVSSGNLSGCKASEEECTPVVQGTNYSTACAYLCGG